MRTGCAIPTMWLGDASTLEAGAPTAGASGEPFDAATGCLFVLFVAANTTAATNSAGPAKRKPNVPSPHEPDCYRLLRRFSKKFRGPRRAG